MPFFEIKWTNGIYDIPVKYAFNSMGKLFVDYLGSTYFNILPFQLKIKKTS